MVKPKAMLRPIPPEKPPVYTGVASWPVIKQNRMIKNGNSAAPSTDGKEYIMGNRDMGGWGAWTISRFTNTAPAGSPTDLSVNLVSHSFGMLGTNQNNNPQDGISKSYVKNFQKDNAITDITIS